MGGLSAAVGDALIVLDAAGYETLIVETVGVGQDEVDIVKTADVTIVVLVPGMGDDIQTIKAGIMEIGDIFVINKADRDGIERTKRELEALLSIAHAQSEWTPLLLETIATEGKGIGDLEEAIRKFNEEVVIPGVKRTQNINLHRLRLMEMLRDRFFSDVVENLAEEELNNLVEKIVARELDPYSVVEELARKMVR